MSVNLGNHSILQCCIVRMFHCWGNNLFLRYIFHNFCHYQHNPDTLQGCIFSIFHFRKSGLFLVSIFHNPHSLNNNHLPHCTPRICSGFHSSNIPLKDKQHKFHFIRHSSQLRCIENKMWDLSIVSIDIISKQHRFHFIGNSYLCYYIQDMM